MFSGIGGAIAISLLALIATSYGAPLLMAPFGASCFLLFAAHESPFAQPRNLIGGHLVSAMVGILVLSVCGTDWWAMGLAVGLSIVAMQLTRTGHPPAGANPIVVLTINPEWSFLLAPVLLGSLTLVAMGLIFNSLRSGSVYPKYWLGQSD
jgi:CBS-domain-containing membrane protein